MPTYTYRCKTCQMIHSHTHGMNENPMPPCPVCRGFSERVASGPPTILTKQTPPSSETDSGETKECNHSCALHCFHGSH